MSIGVLEENTYDRIEANTDCVVAPNSSPVIPPVTAELLAEMSRSICDLAYSESLVLALKYHLENWSDPLRAHQKETFRLLINFLEQGKLHGLIKHPTGAGKTRLFAELLLAMAVPSMILVPRTALLEQTKDTLIDVGFLESDIYVFGQKSWISIEDEVAELRDQKVRPTIYLITYQGLLSLYRNSLELLEYLIKPIKIVVSDEGHRGLGDKTNTLVQDIISPDQSSSTDSDETDQTEETITTEDEIVIDKLLQEQKKLHLSFTATPKLGEKEIQDIYKMEVIDWLRIQTLVEDGTLIFPQRICAGTVRATEDNESRLFSDGYLARLAATERFRTEDGRSVAHACTDTYLLKKQEVGGYLPGVVFCSSIKQAEEYVHYARSRGIRAVRSTSANKSYDSGVSPKDARTMLEADEVDLVVTVSKVGEGWDVPTMRCAIWLKPVYSSANYIQGIGRIIRALIAGSPFPAKSTENTFVIEPDWEVCYRKKDVKSRTPEEEDEEESYKDGRSIDIEDDKESKYHTKKSLNFFEHLIAMDEVHSTFIQDYLSSATEINQRYWTLDQWRKALEELGYNPQQWASMDYEEKVTFEVYGLGLYRLANKFCIAGSPVGNNLFHIQLGLVFWPEAKELKDYISNKEQNDKSLDELGTDPTKWRKVLEDMGYNSQRWAWMTSKEKKVIKIYDLGLQALASIFRVNGNPTANHDFHIQLGNIFWPEAKELKDYISNIEQNDKALDDLSADPAKWRKMFEDMGHNPQSWRKMAYEDKQAIRIHGIGLYAISTKFGLEGDPIRKLSTYIQLGLIFWPESEELQETHKKFQQKSVLRED